MLRRRARDPLPKPVQGPVRGHFLRELAWRKRARAVHRGARVHALLRRYAGTWRRAVESEPARREDGLRLRVLAARLGAHGWREEDVRAWARARAGRARASAT